MKIEWMGHASFILTFKNGKRLCTDPYGSGSYDGAVGYDRIEEEVDYVTVSHDHADHNCTDELRGDFKVINQPGQFRESSIQITGFISFHDASSGSERGSNIIFKIEGDGLSIVHLGDLGHQLSEDMVKELGKIDVLLIPVGGYFTIDSADAWSIIKELKPSIVIPMHFKTEKLGFPIAGVGEFLAGTEEVAHKSELEISPGTLPSISRVVVLNHKR